MFKILLVDDESSIRLTLADALTDSGFQVETAVDGQEGLDLLKSADFNVLVSDIRLPKISGLELFEFVRKTRQDLPVILMTAYGEVNDAVSALKNGVADYLTKPFDYDELILRLQRLAEQDALRKELENMRQELSKVSSETLLVGQSPAMQDLRKRVDTIATSQASVLVVGDSGTGKELVARCLHAKSTNSEGDFVAVNCGAFPETLLEAELFGYERGAFTGATRRRKGRFEAAHGGTLFLDEIGEMPPLAQVKLLRVLQEGIVEPLGTNEARKVDVRVISATHRNLQKQIADGKFREDLYYRLKVMDLRVPPLIERRGDLPILCAHFLKRFSNDKEVLPEITPQAWAALMDYSYPGNVRELEHAIQHAVIMSQNGNVKVEHLPTSIVGVREASGEDGGIERTLAVALKDFEKEFIQRALKLSDGKKAKAAQGLGISRKNLWEKLKQHSI
jgi:DNA-binding NtrC family response regulator